MQNPAKAPTTHKFLNTLDSALKGMLWTIPNADFDIGLYSTSVVVGLVNSSGYRFTRRGKLGDDAAHVLRHVAHDAAPRLSSVIWLPNPPRKPLAVGSLGKTVGSALDALPSHSVRFGRTGSVIWVEVEPMGYDWAVHKRSCLAKRSSMAKIVEAAADTMVKMHGVAERSTTPEARKAA